MSENKKLNEAQEKEVAGGKIKEPEKLDFEGEYVCLDCGRKFKYSNPDEHRALVMSKCPYCYPRKWEMSPLAKVEKR